jgi:hypothetical protein
MLGKFLGVPAMPCPGRIRHERIEFAGLRQRAGVFHFPPWARACVISPETGAEAGEGETGLLRVFDLANIGSVMAVQTEDLAVRRGDGFELLGRAASLNRAGARLRWEIRSLTQRREGAKAQPETHFEQKVTKETKGGQSEQWYSKSLRRCAFASLR